jgi:glycosyltransferase involved in cell wall biosynthesis
MPERAPRVSVCIPVFNGQPFIAQAITSVLRQTYRDLEVIVADNASTDDTLAEVERLADPRLRVLTSESNLGPGHNWNRVVRAARGEYVKLLCADDWLYPTALARQVAVLDARECRDVVLVTAARDVVNGGGRRLMRRGPRGRSRRVSGRTALHDIARSGTNLVGEPSAALFRREAGLAAGLFAADMTYVADVDLWMRLLLRGDLFVLTVPLSAFRVQTGAWSVSVTSRQAQDMSALLRRVAADPRSGVQPWEVRLGGARAMLNANLRRVFYAAVLRRSATEWGAEA